MARRKMPRGSALVLNLTIMAVFAALVAVVYSVTKSQTSAIVYHMHQAQAQTIAEAGLEDALANLYGNTAWRTGFSSKTFAGGFYNVSLSTDTNPVITSSGYSASSFPMGRSVKTVTATAKFINGACPYAIMADQSVSIVGKVDAYDPLVSLTPSSTDFTTGATVRSNTSVSTSGGATCPPTRIRGDVLAPSLPTAACVEGTSTVPTDTVTLPAFNTPSCAATNCDNVKGISPSSAYNNTNRQLDVNSGQTVTISSGTYYIGKMTINGTLSLNTSAGSILLYYDKNISTNSGCQINNTSKIPKRVRFIDVANGGHTITFTCSSGLHAYLEGNNTRFSLGQEMYGHFCSKQVDITSSTPNIGLLHFDIGGGILTHVD
ncbi:MAG: hypothetical protein HY078_04135 [Elusimicrobia bacterium]|nr:hypothetical protein [Elusimicrobiota bacterium]